MRAATCCGRPGCIPTSAPPAATASRAWPPSSSAASAPRLRATCTGSAPCCSRCSPASRRCRRATATDTAVAHLSEGAAGNAVKLAPKGWVSHEDLSDLCEALLDKDPGEPPEHRRRARRPRPAGEGQGRHHRRGAQRLHRRSRGRSHRRARPPSRSSSTLERKADAAQGRGRLHDGRRSDRSPRSCRRGQARENEESAAVAEVKAEAARDRAIET